MRFNPLVRLAAVGAMVTAGSLIMLPAGVASASGSPKPPRAVAVTCTTLTGDETASSFSGCNQPSVTDGTGVTTLNSLSSSDAFTATVTWGSGETTTFAGQLTIVASNPADKKNPDKCPAISGDTPLAEVKEAGTVTGGTALVKGAVKSTECVYNDPTDPVPGGDGTLVDLDGSAKF